MLTFFNKMVRSRGLGFQ